VVRGRQERQGAPQSEKALRRGATLILAWGGVGTVQARVDGVVRAGAGEGVALAIVLAGTAHQLATTIGIAPDLSSAVAVALKRGRAAARRGSASTGAGPTRSTAGTGSPRPASSRA
jgi:diacylglycerol kinase family enzyme